MTDREQTDERMAEALAICRERRDERTDRCMEMLEVIQQKLAWRRANGLGYWLGPAARFRSDIGSEIPLFFVAVDPQSMN